MEFKLKLCFQNDLIRFIGDKLDKICKLILVCMRYFILIEISYFIRKNKSIDYSEAALKV
jgi:hypothetical protein